MLGDRDEACRVSVPSTAVHFPEMFRLISETQEPVARIMPLAAIGAGNEAADVHALAIKVFRNSKARATTTWDEEHAHRIPFLLAHLQGFSPVVKCAHELEFHEGSNPDPVVDCRNRGRLLGAVGLW